MRNRKLTTEQTRRIFGAIDRPAPAGFRIDLETVTECLGDLARFRAQHALLGNLGEACKIDDAMNTIKDAAGLVETDAA
jgi:hypothetical protein